MCIPCIFSFILYVFKWVLLPYKARLLFLNVIYITSYFLKHSYKTLKWGKEGFQVPQCSVRCLLMLKHCFLFHAHPELIYKLRHNVLQIPCSCHCTEFCANLLKMIMSTEDTFPVFKDLSLFCRSTFFKNNIWINFPSLIRTEVSLDRIMNLRRPSCGNEECLNSNLPRQAAENLWMDGSPADACMDSPPTLIQQLCIQLKSTNITEWG